MATVHQGIDQVRDFFVGDRPSQLGHWMVRLASHLLEWDGYGGLSGQLHCTRFSIELSRGRHIAWSCFTSDAKKRFKLSVCESGRVDRTMGDSWRSIICMSCNSIGNAKWRLPSGGSTLHTPEIGVLMRSDECHPIRM